MAVRSRAMNCWGLRSRIGLPVRTCRTSIPASNRPETIRTNAIRSRCRGSMFAWILNTKPVKPGDVGVMGPMVESRGRGGGARERKSRRNGSTPKLVSALPK